MATTTNKPPRLQPGQVIDKYGTYRFPSGNRELTIDLDDSGNVHITTHEFTTEYYVIPRVYDKSILSFESERGWFASIDEYHRLWIFHGRWDDGLGPPRRMPAGGTAPYTAAVIRDGMWSDGPGIVCDGAMLVTETGDWDGVPGEFFDRLPVEESDMWPRHIPPFPQAPPPLTKQQKADFGGVLSKSGWMN